MIKIHDKNGALRYGIKRDGDSNYEIMEWSPEHPAEKNGRNTKKGDIIPAKWMSKGIYPSSLDYAVLVIYDMLVAEFGTKHHGSLKEALAEIKELRDNLVPQIAAQLKVKK